MNWHDYRLRYPALQNRIYLNTAACGLISTGTQAAVQVYWDELLNSGSLHRMTWEAQIQSTREAIAQSLGVPAPQLSLLSNFTVGMNYAAQLLGGGKKVLLIEGEYASVKLPWETLGYQCEQCRPEADGSIPLSTLWKHIQRFQPDILALSHVMWHTGYAFSLPELSHLCQEAGICLVVDATQSWCMLPINLAQSPVDVFIASGYKWSTAGFGNAIMYVSEEVWERGALPITGMGSTFLWGENRSLQTNVIPPMGLEAGHHDYASLAALGHAWRELHEIGFDTIGERVLYLTHYLHEELKRIGWPIVSSYNRAFRSGITAIGGPESIVETLASQGIDISYRAGNLRISVHFYNQKAEIDQLISALKNLNHR